jgi:hypothetical protein
VLEISLDKEDPAPLIFAILQRDEMARFQHYYQDIEYFGTEIAIPGLSDRLVVFSEHKSFAKVLFTPQMVKSMNKHEKVLSAIHITDQQTFGDMYSKPLISQQVSNASPDQPAQGHRGLRYD